MRTLHFCRVHSLLFYLYSTNSKFLHCDPLENIHNRNGCIGMFVDNILESSSEIELTCVCTVYLEHFYLNWSDLDLRNYTKICLMLIEPLTIRRTLSLYCRHINIIELPKWTHSHALTQKTVVIYPSHLSNRM